MSNGPIFRGVERRITIGTTVDDGRPFEISGSDLKSHALIVGPTGMGKTRLLCAMYAAMVRARLPSLVIEPHGDFTDFALQTLRRAGMPPERVVLIRPSDRDFVVGFDPLRAVPDPGEATSLVIEAVQAAFSSGNSIDLMPRMERVLAIGCGLLIPNGMPISELATVLAADNVSGRRALAERVDDPWLRQELIEFDAAPRSERLAVTESTRNRLQRFMRGPLQLMFSQVGNTLDLYKMFEDGTNVILDLSGLAAPEARRLTAALYVNAAHHAARRRSPHNPRPYYIVCEEASEYLTDDLARSLDALRKYGLFFAICVQRLASARLSNPDVLSALLANTPLKFAFGRLQRADAELLAKEFYTGEVDGRSIKHVIQQTKFRPSLGTFVVESESEGETLGESEAAGESFGSTASSGFSEGRHITTDGYGLTIEPEIVGESTAQNHSQSSSAAASASRGSSRSVTRSRSRSVVPITTQTAFLETTGITYESLDEAWEARVARLVTLPRQEVMVKVGTGRATHVRIADVHQVQVDRRFERYERAVLERCPHVSRADVAERQVEDRRQRLNLLGEAAEERGRPFSVRSFRE